MVSERERGDWLRTMTATAYVVKALDGADLDPMQMIPPALRLLPAPVKLTEEQEKAETRAALMLMGECLKMGA